MVIFRLMTSWHS